MDDPVLQTVELGPQWPTIDPFLFCAHHDDAYPAGDERMAPAVPLGERDMGQDFSGRDGFSMYHGLVVPGFPSSTTPTRLAPPPGSGAVTCSG